MRPISLTERYIDYDQKLWAWGKCNCRMAVTDATGKRYHYRERIPLADRYIPSVPRLSTFLKHHCQPMVDLYPTMIAAYEYCYRTPTDTSPPNKDHRQSAKEAIS